MKFKLGGRLVYKSRTVYRDLNPTWDESFTVPIEDAFVPVQIKVFDYDWGLQVTNRIEPALTYLLDLIIRLQDDFMGACQLDLTSLELGRAADLTIPLQDPSKAAAPLGEISLTITLYPKTQEDKEQVRNLCFVNIIDTFFIFNLAKSTVYFLRCVVS